MNRTIKFTLTLTIMACLTALMSCQKDKTGVYAPQKKIQQIYYSSSEHEKSPYQHWDWNDNLLGSITHYDNFDFKSSMWIEDFTYEDNRVTRVDNYTDSEYITYKYDGNYLKSATVYYHNAIVNTWMMNYEGDHLSKLTGTFYLNKKGDPTSRLNPLSHLLPSCACEKIAKYERQMANQRQQEETITLTLLLTWTDDNISKIAFTGDGEYYEMQLQYDDKNCPYYGFMGSFVDYPTNYIAGHTGFTKHNVTSMIIKRDPDDSHNDTINYAYQYDSDGLPVLQTMYFSDDPDDKQVFYYEY